MNATAQTIVLWEDFSDNRRKWDEDTTDTEECYVKSGRYHIRVNEESGGNWHWFALPVNINESKNWVIESNIYLEKMETEDGFFGVFWGANEAKNMHQVIYYPKTKTASSAHVVEWEYYRLMPVIQMDSLNDTKIKFTIVKNQNRYYCLLNGQPYGKATASNLMGNKIGFLLSGNSEISIEDITLNYVDANSQILRQINNKFPPTEERLMYYQKNLPWTVDENQTNGIRDVRKEEADIYRVYTVNDDDSVIGYVKEYDAKTNKLIHKFQAKKISKFLKNGDILVGDYMEYNEDGNIEFKAIYINPDNLSYDSFMKFPTINFYNYDSKERIEEYREVKDGNLRREIKFDEDGIIERAQNFDDLYHYEKNNFGKYDKVIEERFNPAVLGWPEGEISSSASKYTEKGYYVKAKQGDAGRTSKIPLDFNNSDFSVGLFVNIRGEGTAGVMLGTDKMGMNYTCLGISHDGQFSIFNMYNGVRMPIAEWTQSNNFREGINALDIIKIGKTIFFSINGTKVKSADYFPLANKTIGLNVNGIGNEVYFSDMIIREIGVELPEEFSKFLSKANEGGFVTSGTGFFISNNGYIITNNHVVESAKEIYVEVTENELTKTYRATLVKTDPKNDLATLKINKTIGTIPYALKSGLADVGSKIFTLGYPYALTYLGKEIKFTEGSVSSKTGYGNDINIYQISVPVQPGNSGGPLFDDKGNLVGVVNAKFTKGDNVAYAIKSPLLKTFLDLNPTIPKLSAIQSNTEINIVTLIKKVEKFVVLIKIK